MIRFRSLPLALALSFAAGAAHADDLLQVYQEARASDPTLAGAEATKLATDENVDQARSQLLPQIGVNLDFTRSRAGENGIVLVPDPATPNDPNALIPVDGVSKTSYTRSTSASLSQSILDISKWTALKATTENSPRASSVCWAPAPPRGQRVRPLRLTRMRRRGRSRGCR